MKRDDLTITIEGHPASGARKSIRLLLEGAIIQLGGKTEADGPLVSTFDLHGAHILIQLHEPALPPRRRKRR